MSIRNDIIKLLLHGFIGSLLGFLFMHPASILIHTLILTPEDFSLRQIVLDCFSHQKFPMTLYFGALGFVFGLVQGFYSHQIARLLQNINRLTLNEAANKLYERFFQKAAFNTHSESTEGIANSATIEDCPVWIEVKTAAIGCAAGYARLHYEAEDFFSLINTGIDRIYSLQDFKESLSRTVEQIKSMQGQAEARFAMDATKIFEAHLLIVTDNFFVNPITELISKGENAPNALMKVATNYIDTLSLSESLYIQDKINDLKDIVLRLLQNMLDKTRSIQCAGSIIFAHNLYPSDLLQMSVEGALGIVLLSGGTNSHIAILAQSLRIPMVIADTLTRIDQIIGKLVLVDANRGKICVNPIVFR